MTKGGTGVGSVTTSESLVLYVFAPFCLQKKSFCFVFLRTQVDSHQSVMRMLRQLPPKHRSSAPKHSSHQNQDSIAVNYFCHIHIAHHPLPNHQSTKNKTPGPVPFIPIPPWWLREITEPNK